MDKLEQFIIDQKDQFDQPRQPEAGWEQLAKKLNKRQPDRMFYWKVAAVFFFASTVVLGFVLLSQQSGDDVQLVSTDATFEQFYINQINQKMTEYDQLVGSAQGEELYNDLADFEAAYQELSASFKLLGTEKLAEAMLENLRLRILILNEQIELIKQGKAKEETYHSS
jgi:hypothetical protein